eukprot:833126-Pelagomonas_calceolata.AAC.9
MNDSLPGKRVAYGSEMAKDNLPCRVELALGVFFSLIDVGSVFTACEPTAPLVQPQPRTRRPYSSCFRSPQPHPVQGLQGLKGVGLQPKNLADQPPLYIHSQVRKTAQRERKNWISKPAVAVRVARTGEARLAPDQSYPVGCKPLGLFGAHACICCMDLLYGLSHCMVLNERCAMKKPSSQDMLEGALWAAVVMKCPEQRLPGSA